jgi:coenzyme F420-reducing hydrogenase gamma subunit
MSATPPLPSVVKTKIKVGWFSFSCCEDSTVVFTELLNDHWQDWKQLFEFCHARVLKSHNVMTDFDIAFVEGAVASDDHIKTLKEIRQRSKKLVAIGACACQGLPSAQRNSFTPAQQQEIEFLLARFSALPKVLKLSEVVKVDEQVPGCPMDPKIFLSKVEALVKEFLPAGQVK